MTYPVRLVGESVVVREFDASDRDPFRTLLADPRLYAYGRAPRDADAADRYLDRILADAPTRQPGTGFSLAVDVGGTLIGWANLWRHEREPLVAELGWELDPERWGWGYATEVTRLLLGLAFGSMGVSRVEAVTDAENVAASRVLRKCGFVVVPRDDGAPDAEDAGRDQITFAKRRS